jgi:plasmid stability protein
MPKHLELKNVPDEVYERLEASAKSRKRSMNSEAIACLESILVPQRVAMDERLTRARALRAALPEGTFSAKDIAAFKRDSEQ